MKAFLQFSAALALLSVAVGAAFLSWDVHQLSTQVRLELTSQTSSLAQTEHHLDAVLETVNSAATEQRAYWQKTSADSDKTVKALRVTIDRAGLLLKHADESQRQLTSDVHNQLNATSESAQLALSSLSHSAEILEFQLNETDFGPALVNLSESSSRLAVTMGNLQDASGHANNILLDGEKTADYYERKLTTPASFAHRVAMTALDVGSKLGNIMAGFVK